MRYQMILTRLFSGQIRNNYITRRVRHNEMMARQQGVLRSAELPIIIPFLTSASGIFVLMKKYC